MEEKVYASSRGEIHYWCSIKRNSPICLVLLHGLTADHRLFYQQVKAFSKRYFLLLWDAPGHGLSRPYTDFSYDHCADDLFQILQQEGIQKVVLVGQSMGGFISQSFISKFPHLVKGFIGIDTCPYGLKYYSKVDNWLLKQVGWMCRFYFHKILLRRISEVATCTEGAYHNMLEMLSEYSKSYLCKLVGYGMGQFPIANHDLEIKCPVIILIGEYDNIGKTKQYCKAWHESTQYPIYYIQKAGHNANDDNPLVVNQIINDFIAPFCPENQESRQ